MSEDLSPSLNLVDVPGPSLKLSPSSLGSALKDSGTPLAVGVFAVLSVLFALVLVPVSKVATGHPSETWSIVLEQLVNGSEALFEVAMPPPAMPTPEPDSKPAPGPDPFASAALAPLKGAYCMDYMPGGNNPRAVQAFNQLVWSKLNKELQEIADERLEVCMPFESLTLDVIAAGGCAKSQCGTNDVTFYINEQGLTAVDYRINGECRQASETGFTQTQLLCR